MNIWTDEITNLIVSIAISLLVPYCSYALERYLKIRLDAAARETLGSAMRNGVDWIISRGVNAHGGGGDGACEAGSP